MKACAVGKEFLAKKKDGIMILFVSPLQPVLNIKVCLVTGQAGLRLGMNYL